MPAEYRGPLAQEQLDADRPTIQARFRVMVTRISAAAQRDLDAVIHTLRAERVRRGDLTQRRLAEVLGVAMGSLKDWELRRDNPTMINCVRWAQHLGFHLVVDDAAAAGVCAPVTPAAHEGWESAEIRRLTSVLRAARTRRRIRQADLALQLGIARGSLVRWETGKGPPPRPAGLAQWARSVGCVVRLEQG